MPPPWILTVHWPSWICVTVARRQPSVSVQAQTSAPISIVRVRIQRRLSVGVRGPPAITRKPRATHPQQE